VKISVQFFSYFRDLTGCAETKAELPSGATLGQLHDQLAEKFPALGRMRRSSLLAVGVDYQGRDHVLQDGDVVSLFPPVQGG